MRTSMYSLAGISLLGTVHGNVVPPQPRVTAFHTVEVVARQDVNLPNLPAPYIAAIEPTQEGQIGINPPDPAPFSGSVGPYTKFLIQDGENYGWIGPDPAHITVFESTKTQDGSVSTVTQDIGIATNAAGGLDLVLSPFLKDKLNAIASNVTPCGAAKRAVRGSHRKRQGGPVCGSLDFAQRVSQDSDLSGFSEQLDEAIRNSIDSGYESMSVVDEDGWVDAISEDGGEELVENFIISTGEEAAVVAGAAADGVAADAIFAGATITTGSFLALLWSSFISSGNVQPVYNLPKESVHKISKTSSESSDEATSTTTSGASCPTMTGGFQTCESDCVPTRVAGDAQVTEGAGWACSEGEHKDCECVADYLEVVHPYDSDIQEALQETFDSIEDEDEEEPEISCDGSLSSVPSEFLPDIISNFCLEAMGSPDGTRVAGRAYDIHGYRLPNLRKRAPPESADNYEDYVFFLHWEPSDGECIIDEDNLCEDAFEEMRKARCGSNHGSAGDRMTEVATINVGCGEFGWEVEKGPEPEPLLKELECNEAKDEHAVDDQFQDVWASLGCDIFANKTLDADSDKITWTPPEIHRESYQNFQISWIEGCDLLDEQDALKPIPDDETSCYGIMRGLYKNCNNQGTGGSKEAGCLKYEFWKD